VADPNRMRGTKLQGLTGSPTVDTQGSGLRACSISPRSPENTQENEKKENGQGHNPQEPIQLAQQVRHE